MPLPLTPELAQLTLPEERKLIEDLETAIEVPRLKAAPAYRIDLPYHNDYHIYREVLPAGLRLDGRDGKNSTPRSRPILIAGLITHDMWSHVPLDPAEGFRTKEQRTAALARPILLNLFSEADTNEVEGTIIATTPGVRCETPNQRKIRRADISNVGIRNSSTFLATTVRIFHEEVVLCLEAGEDPPLWTPFLDRQHAVLGKLLEQDLSVGTEPLRNGKGPFNLAAESNVSLLGTKCSVRNPKSFVSRYGQYMKPLVPAFQDIVPYIKAEAAA